MKKKLAYVLMILLMGSLTSCTESTLSTEEMKNISEEESITMEMVSKDEMSIEDYLVGNNEALTDIESLEGLMISDEELQKYEIFLTGEIHGIKANSQLGMAFLKYFKERTDFKYLLEENSYSSSHFLNKFLETGDMTVLDRVYERRKRGNAYDQEGYDYYLELYRYNGTLSEDRKIRIVGIDIEHDVKLAYRYLIDIIPKEDAPSEIRESVEMLKETHDLIEKSTQNKYKGEKNAATILDDIKLNRKSYELYFGEDAPYLELVLTNIINGEQAYKLNYDPVEWNNARDKMIYDNFGVVDDILPKGSYYGQWGAAHIFQEEDSDVKWLGAYLNSNSKYENKVLSIMYNYIDCEMKTGVKEKTKVTFALPFVAEFVGIDDQDFIMFKVNGEEANRPFIPMNNIYAETVSDKDVSKFIQYIILVRNSGANEPLDH